MQDVSELGHKLAVALADKVLTSVEDFPGADDREKRDILTLIAAKVLVGVVESV